MRRRGKEKWWNVTRAQKNIAAGAVKDNARGVLGF
jgi:hypothetical protein